mgnify:CR=1 FL=1
MDILIYNGIGICRCASMCLMDSSRCVVIELGSQDEIPLLRYLTKNKEQYNWIFGETDKTRACVWWMKNVEFSTTPLRSVLKRLSTV